MLYSTQNITRLGKLTLVESLLKRKQYAKALEIYIAHIDGVGFSDRFYERAWSVYCKLGAYIKRDSKKIVARKEKPLQTNVSLNLLEIEAIAKMPEPAEEADREKIDPDVESDPCPIQGTEESTLPKDDEAEDSMGAHSTEELTLPKEDEVEDTMGAPGTEDTTLQKEDEAEDTMGAPGTEDMTLQKKDEAEDTMGAHCTEAMTLHKEDEAEDTMGAHGTEDMSFQKEDEAEDIMGAHRTDDITLLKEDEAEVTMGINGTEDMTLQKEEEVEDTMGAHCTEDMTLHKENEAEDTMGAHGTEDMTFQKEEEVEDTMGAHGSEDMTLQKEEEVEDTMPHVFVIEGGRRDATLSDPVQEAGATVMQSDSPRTTEPATNISHSENVPKNSGSPVADEELIESFATPTAVTTQPLKKSLSKKQRLMPWLCCRREQTISIG